MNALFLSVRVLHIALGATWLGMAVLITYFLLPAVQEAGPDGGKVMIALVRRRLATFISSVAGLTVLSGFYLYWRLTNGFDPVISGSMEARVFGAGGVLGLVAAIIGGSVVAKNMKKAVALMSQLGAADATTRASVMERAMAHRQKAATGSRIVAILLMVTIVLMALGHYV